MRSRASFSLYTVFSLIRSKSSPPLIISRTCARKKKQKNTHTVPVRKGARYKTESGLAALSKKTKTSSSRRRRL